MGFKNTEKKEWEEFLSVVKQNYLLILGFIICSCIAAVIITFFIPKKYASSAVVFPTDTNSLDDAIRNPQFGYDVEADRLIQILESRMVRDSIVKKFDLVKYYEIDKKDADWDYQLTKKFQHDITFLKTIYMSVIISAETRSPEMSANIVNEIITQIGKIRDKLLKTNVYMAISALQRENKFIKSDLDSLSGVLNGMARSRKEITQYIQTDRNVALIFDKNQMSDDNAGKALQMVVDQYNVKLNWFYDVQNKQKNATIMSQRPLPSVYVIDSAIPSYKKTYPKYSVNLIIAFVGSFIIISFLLFLIQKFRTPEEKIAS